MKSKTLSAIAVAAALGLSATAFAGSGHEVVTPMSPNESGQAMPQHFSSHQMSMLQASSGDTFSGNVGGLELSDATDWSASYDQMAEAGELSTYMISYMPITIDGLDYYLIDLEPISLTAEQELALFGEDESLGFDGSAAFTQEESVAMTLAESPVQDTAEAG